MANMENTGRRGQWMKKDGLSLHPRSRRYGRRRVSPISLFFVGCNGVARIYRLFLLFLLFLQSLQSLL
jgi:hypothetical protein